VTVTVGVSPYYRRLREGWKPFLRREARYVGELTRREVAELTPVARVIDPEGRDRGQSGHAKRSWQPIEPRARGGAYESGASSDDSVIPILETGARRHIILPRAGNAELVFWSRGRRIHAERVNHPGFPGFHMMERGLRNAEREYARVIDRHLQTFLDEQQR
jgi:hypothetical protein